MTDTKSDVEQIADTVKASTAVVVKGAEVIIKPVVQLLGLEEEEEEPKTKSEKKAARKEIVKTVLEKKKAERKARAPRA